MVHKGCAEEVMSMEKLKVTVDSVKVFDDREYPTVQFVFKETVKGYAKADTNSFREGDVNTISINRAQLTKELCNCNDLIDEYRGCREKAFDQKAFGLILRGATLTIVRSKHTKGEVVKDVEGNDIKDGDGNPIVYNRDCYTTNVVGVTLTPRAEEKLEQACSLD